MGRFVLRRLLQGIPTMFGVTLVSFALWRFSPGDPVSLGVFGVAGHAIPSFWFGYLFILILAVQFRLFPVGGMLTIGKSELDVGDRLRHLVGPAVALSLAGIANYSRLMRTETLDVLGQDF